MLVCGRGAIEREAAVGVRVVGDERERRPVVGVAGEKAVGNPFGRECFSEKVAESVGREIREEPRPLA